MPPSHRRHVIRQVPIIRLSVDGVLDLHHFRPAEVPDLVNEYLRECKRLGICEVRIIHGKGKGVLRAIVQDILERNPNIWAFGPPHDGSGWGVTIASLRCPEKKLSTTIQAAMPARWRRWLPGWLRRGDL